MAYSYHTILVPVDLSQNSEVALQKALALAGENTTIHLLHVCRKGAKGPTSNFIDQPYYKNHVPAWKKKREALRQLKQTIENVGNICVHTWVSMHASVQQAIEVHAKTLGADLVVIAKKSNHSLFPFLNTVVPGMIVLHTGITVLTVKPGCLDHNIRTVVVPVTGHITHYKLDAIAAIAHKYPVQVHLVTFMEGKKGPSEFYAAALLQVYQWLRGNLNCAVQYAVLHGTNKAMAIIRYAQENNADVLLVHPESETRVGWLNCQISDVLPAASKVQVLVVQQPELSIN